MEQDGDVFIMRLIRIGRASAGRPSAQGFGHSDSSNDSLVSRSQRQAEASAVIDESQSEFHISLFSDEIYNKVSIDEIMVARQGAAIGGLKTRTLNAIICQRNRAALIRRANE